MLRKVKTISTPRCKLNRFLYHKKRNDQCIISYHLIETEKMQLLIWALVRNIRLTEEVLCGSLTHKIKTFKEPIFYLIAKLQQSLCHKIPCSHSLSLHHPERK